MTAGSFSFLHKYYRKILDDTFYRNTVILLIFSNSVHLLSAIIQYLGNRNLSPDDFGQMNNILTLFIIFSIVGQVLEQWTIKSFTEIFSRKAFDKISPSIRYFARIILQVLVFLLVLMAPVFIFGRELFKADSLMPFFYLLTGVLIKYVILLPRSILHGHHDFLPSSFSLFSGTVLKLVLFGGFILTGLTLGKTLLAHTMSLFLALLLTAFFAHRLLLKTSLKAARKKKIELDSRNFLTFFKVGLPTIFITLVIYYDMPLVRIMFSQETSGEYATARMLGMIIFHFGTTFLPIFYTVVNEAFYKKEDLLKPFLKGLAMSIILISGAFFGLYFGLNYLIPLLKPDYAGSFAVIWQYSLAMVPYTLLSMMVSFYTSAGLYRIFYLMLALLGGQAALLYFLAADVETLITYKNYSGWLMFALLFIFLVIKRKHIKFQERKKN